MVGCDVGLCFEVVLDLVIVTFGGNAVLIAC